MTPKTPKSKPSLTTQMSSTPSINLTSYSSKPITNNLMKSPPQSLHGSPNLKPKSTLHVELKNTQLKDGNASKGSYSIPRSDAETKSCAKRYDIPRSLTEWEIGFPEPRGPVFNSSGFCSINAFPGLRTIQNRIRNLLYNFHYVKLGQIGKNVQEWENVQEWDCRPGRLKLAHK